MASVEKYTEPKLMNQIKHIERQFKTNSNKDIVEELTAKNYSLSPVREISSKQAYLRRKSELYAYGRDNLICGFGWVVTAPGDLPESKEKEFFQASYDFITDRYGGPENVISAQVHYDEGVRDQDGNLIAGRPHMHVLMIPVVPDRNAAHWQEEKICCKEVINKADLRSWHDDYQAYLDSVPGLNARVKTGKTASQGGNISVAQYKQITKSTLERQQEIQREKGMRNLTNDRWHGTVAHEVGERWR